MEWNEDQKHFIFNKSDSPETTVTEVIECVGLNVFVSRTGQSGNIVNILDDCV